MARIIGKDGFATGNSRSMSDKTASRILKAASKDKPVDAGKLNEAKRAAKNHYAMEDVKDSRKNGRK